jgi:hypothetical protein
MSFNNRFAFLKHKYFHISITSSSSSSSINKNKSTNKYDIDNFGEKKLIFFGDKEVLSLFFFKASKIQNYSSKLAILLETFLF